MSTIETLRNKRTHLKGTGTRLENFLNGVTNETSLFEIRARLERLEKLYESFQALDIEMAALGDNIPEHDAEIEEFETRYFRLKTRYCEIIDCRLHSLNPIADSLNSTTMHQDAMQKLLESQASFLEKLSALQLSTTNFNAASLSQAANTSIQSTDVRLPKLNIPEFKGKYSDFRSFFDLFTSSVHNNHSLTAAQKFQYLKGFLKGEPATLIRHLAVSDQNYDEALKKIQERYDKPSMVIDSLIETFLFISKADGPQGLRNVSNVADEVIRGLRAQGPDAEKRDPWLIHLLLKKVDRDTHQSWAEHCSKITFPTLENFLTFMNERCDALERVPSANDKQRTSGPSAKTKLVRPYSSVMKKACAACSQDHFLAYCPTFAKLSVPNRINFIKEKRLCFHCLKPGHLVQNCPSKHVCESCKARHHSCIHLERSHIFKTTTAAIRKTTDFDQPKDEKVSSQESKKTEATMDPVIVSDTSIHLSALSEARNLNMLLPTARVLIKDNMGCFQICNILLDSGCQNTLISERCVNRLGLKRTPSKIFVSGLGNNKAGATRGVVELQVKSLYSSEYVIMLAHVFKSLTSQLPCSPITINYWNEVKKLPLADPLFDTPKEIDILVGCDYFFNLLRNGRVSKDGNLLAQNTMFGYVLCGGCMTENTISACHVMTQTTPDIDLNKTLQLFWQIESVPQRGPNFTAEDQQTEEFYKLTTTRAERYTVRLPFTQNPVIGDSYPGAWKRLLAMEKKFKLNPDLKQAYSEFLSEYLKLGHMKIVPPEKIKLPSGSVYYLPHHAVLRENSLTTKLRVVFDGSYKSSNGKSINDNLLKGPTLQQDLLAVTLRYRCKKYCLSADIKQMFRMINIHECDQDYLRILWRESTTKEVQHYRLTTVTYGTRPAPYLSIRTLLQLSDDEKDRYPLGSEAIKNSFYVDDCMAGSNTIEEAQELAGQINKLLMAGGFHLRKWATNDSQILLNIPDSAKIDSIVSIPSEITVCLLGIIWNPINDCFSYKVKEKEYCLETKRNLLSEISKIFDPLGWISPAIIAVKIIIQKLWLSNLDWDELLPNRILHEVKLLFSEFHLLDNINIPLLIFSTEKHVTFHGYCDASSSAYAAVIYCRKVSADELVSANIVISKTRVAPIASLSIPRLELCASYLLTELFKYVMSVINVNMSDVVCWSDSKTVLAWLSSHPSKWKTFISHRTSYILETLPRVNWRYVPSKQNPADVASRGVRSSVLLRDDMWFRGPSWLIEDDSYWPAQDSKEYTTQEELRPANQVALTSTAYNTDLIDRINERISCWTKIVRVLAYCYRFINILKSQCRNNIPLRVEELKTAEAAIYKYYQEAEFPEIIESLKKGRAIITNKKLKKLSPFLDSDGLLRVGGRLSRADLSYDSQHQIILYKNSPIVKKIVQDLHLKNLHAGITLLVATLRQKYWIIGAREVIKTVTRQCGLCTRYNARAQEQLMGDLPKFRVNTAFPFYEVGCDYAGPILYKQHNGRKSPIVKAYVAVFICLVTKAVHLELVSDLSTDAFLAALDRFVARRGLCAHIHSDNGTNFRGAARKLNEIHQLVTSSKSNNDISNFLSSKGIQWHFIPPGAPHFGGAWESTVKSMKFYLQRTIGQATLNFEELSTLLARIEAILNSRPLVQADSDDIPYLTPGHFITGRPLNALPETDATHLKTSLLSKWRLIQQLTQYFWSLWSTEYLLSLQPKSKWLKENANLSVGDIVLLREENVPPAYWKLGRIIETHAGPDGLVRVVTVRTENSTFKRPIAKIHPLPKDC